MPSKIPDNVKYPYTHLERREIEPFVKVRYVDEPVFINYEDGVRCPRVVVSRRFDTFEQAIYYLESHPGSIVFAPPRIHRTACGDALARDGGYVIRSWHPITVRQEETHQVEDA